jgi:hypothetical protein
MKLKETTTTTLVLEALVRSDDFMTARQLVAATGRNGNQVSAALYDLRKYKAADCMVAGEMLWWYATPGSDQRTRVVEERSPETKPRKQRKLKRKEV